jgi:glycogen debranching enzyme
VSQAVDLHRLPELFCGLERREGESPTLYPVACSPQAWSAGSVLLFLQACLGISVDANHKQLSLYRPLLPDCVPQVWIKNLTVNSSTVDLFLERSGETVRVHVLGRHPDLRVVLH